jgi:hypothetical protein
VIVIVSAVIGTITSAMICALLTWRFMSKHRGNIQILINQINRLEKHAI